VGEMLEVWGVDSLQEMLDTSPLQHSSQVVEAEASQWTASQNSFLKSFSNLRVVSSL